MNWYRPDTINGQPVVPFGNWFNPIGDNVVMFAQETYTPYGLDSYYKIDTTVFMPAPVVTYRFSDTPVTSFTQTTFSGTLDNTKIWASGLVEHQTYDRPTTYYSSYSYSVDVSLPLPGGTLFTSSVDRVDFNNLSSVQSAAVAAGAGLYNALEGNDVVTLPDVENANQPVGEGKTLSWNFALTFNAGPGNDRITAGDGDDKIEGGDGDDTIHSSPGNDVVTGGNGFDTFDYQTRTFTGYAAGTAQTLDGGANLEDQSDLILLPGSADDYTFDVSFGPSWAATTTTIKPTLQTCIQPFHWQRKISSASSSKKLSPIAFSLPAPMSFWRWLS